MRRPCTPPPGGVRATGSEQGRPSPPPRAALSGAVTLFALASGALASALILAEPVLSSIAGLVALILAGGGVMQIMRWQRARPIEEEAATWMGDPSLECEEEEERKYEGLSHAGLESFVSPGQLLAEGGMARVMVASWRETDEQIVWKQAQERHNPLVVANVHIDREAAVLRAVDHPRMPKWLADGQVRVNDTERASVIVQEWIDGETLLELMQRHYHAGTVADLPTAREVMAGICEPLEELESRRMPIIHGDLKPDNVILQPRRGPVVIDLGLSETLSGRHLQRTQAIRGSGTWTAPERLEGWVAPSTDVYTLGKLLFLMLTARTPPEEIEQRHFDWLESKGVPPHWLRLIEWSCRKDPIERPQSAKRFRRQLERLPVVDVDGEGMNMSRRGGRSPGHRGRASSRW